MAFTIAVAGKGGTGKTTTAALATIFLAEQKKGSILTVDADPNSNLAEALGLEQTGSIVEIVDSTSKSLDQVPAGMTKERFLELRLQEAISEGDKFDLLAMGRPEGPGCYCYVNNTLRNLLKKITSGYDFVVVDNEAGLEHLSRRTTGEADLLLLVSDPTVVGLRSAGRVLELIKELNLNFKKKVLVLNKAGTDDATGSLSKMIDSLGADSTVVMPLDEDILRLSMEGRPLTGLDRNKNVKKALNALLAKII